MTYGPSVADLTIRQRGTVDGRLVTWSSHHMCTHSVRRYIYGSPSIQLNKRWGYHKHSRPLTLYQQMTGPWMKALASSPFLFPSNFYSLIKPYTHDFLFTSSKEDRTFAGVEWFFC